MIITIDNITLGNQTFEARMVGYERYITEVGSITINGKTFESTKISGFEGYPNLICSNRLLCSESAII